MVDKKDKAGISPQDKPVFYWQAIDFESHDKPKGWTTMVVLAGVILAGIFVLMGLWLAVAVVAAAIFALLSQANSRGKKRNYALYDQGVTVDDKVFSFDQFKSFWIFPYQERFVVRFDQLRRFSLPVEMPIDGENPEQIRLFLTKHLPEAEDRGEDVSDTINRWIKF